jgi:hypothetical protein
LNRPQNQALAGSIADCGLRIANYPIRPISASANRGVRISVVSSLRLKIGAQRRRYPGKIRLISRLRE